MNVLWAYEYMCVCVFARSSTRCLARAMNVAIVHRMAKIWRFFEFALRCLACNRKKFQNEYNNKCSCMYTHKIFIGQLYWHFWRFTQRMASPILVRDDVLFNELSCSLDSLQTHAHFLYRSGCCTCVAFWCYYVCMSNSIPIPWIKRIVQCKCLDSGQFRMHANFCPSFDWMIFAT